MTREEAIVFLYDIMTDCVYRITSDEKESCEMAIEALKKQIPKKPDFEADGYDDHGNLIYDTWICPCCEKGYEVEYEEYDYCPNCGQKLDWSDTE